MAIVAENSATQFGELDGTTAAFVQPSDKFVCLGRPNGDLQLSPNLKNDKSTHLSVVVVDIRIASLQTQCPSSGLDIATGLCTCHAKRQLSGARAPTF